MKRRWRARLRQRVRLVLDEEYRRRCQRRHPWHVQYRFLKELHELR